MPPAPLTKIGRRIIALILATVAITVAAASAIIVSFQFNRHIEESQASLKATGYVFASAIAEHVGRGDKREALKVLRSITRVPAVAYAAVYDVQGREIAALGSAVLTGDDLSGEVTGPLDLLSRGLLPVKVDIVRNGVVAGRLVLVADVSGLRGEIARFAGLTLLAGLFASLLGVAFALRLQRRISQPIASLTQAMSHIRDAADYTTVVAHEADDETGILVDTFNSMIAEIRARDQKLEEFAYFDELTGLPNRRNLEAHLLRLAQAAEPAALLLIDLDEFKDINQSYGRGFADEVLLRVIVLLQSFAPEGTFLARIGGDMFAAAVPGIAGGAAALDAAGHFGAAFLQPVKTGGREIAVSISIGAVHLAGEACGATELLRRAELALEEARRRGRASFRLYDEAVDVAAKARVEMAQDLRRAIQEGTLMAYFQPQVDIAHDKVAGFEALLRWKHPEKGFISPGDFIPVAEANGLIGDLGRWVLRESCERAMGWLDAGEAPRRISVNVSALQIREEGFVEEVERVLADTQLPAGLLCLELTESLFVGAARTQVRAKLERLKALGVRLALDDFGTGYSSLSYLRELPFDELKIDRSFVSGIDGNPGKRVLFEGILVLARALNLEVVAEGAETPGELATLKAIGVEQVQGYVFAKPVAANEVPALAARITQELSGRTQVTAA